MPDQSNQSNLPEGVRLKAERQRWLDADVGNVPYIERLEERQSELESALRPLLEAKPMPGPEDDTYVLQGVAGEALRAAKRAFAGSAVLAPGEVVTDPDDPLLRPDALDSLDPDTPEGGSDG